MKGLSGQFILFPFLQTVRARLILWNVLVLTLVLLLLGGLLRVSVAHNLLASVDDDLATQARQHTERWQRPPRPGPGDGPPPFHDHHTPRDDFPPFQGGGGFGGHGGPHGSNDRYTPEVNGQGRPNGGPPPEEPNGDPGPPHGGPGSPHRGGPHGPNGPQPFQQNRLLQRLLGPTGKPLFPGPAGQASNLNAPLDQAALTHAMTGWSGYTDVERDGETVRVYSAPLKNRGHIDGVVQVGYPLTDIERAGDSLNQTLLTLLPFAVVFAGAGGLFLTGRVLRPVRQVTHTAATLGAQDLSQRLTVRGNDEFSELAATFNAMLARLEHAFEQQRRFTADASHELRTPLTVVRANSSLMLSRADLSDVQRKALGSIERAADLMGRTVQDLLLLARSDAGQLGLQLRPTPLSEILDTALVCVPARSGVELVNQADNTTLTVEADAPHLTRLFVNLLENALRHTSEGGRVTVSAQESGEWVAITVSDTGVGIAPEHLAHLGERFYRVDEARTRAAGGTGLGLAICRSIAEAHGGTLAFQSEPGQGTQVRVLLPFVPPTLRSL